MTVLKAAMQRMAERTAAMGAVNEGETAVVNVEAGGLALLLSGLPVTADELHGQLFGRARDGLLRMAGGEDAMAVFAGALVEAILLGYYMGQEELG